MYLNRDSACKGMAYFYFTKRFCYFFEKENTSFHNGVSSTVLIKMFYYE